MSGIIGLIGVLAALALLIVLAETKRVLAQRRPGIAASFHDGILEPQTRGGLVSAHRGIIMRNTVALVESSTPSKRRVTAVSALTPRTEKVVAFRKKRPPEV
jgi:hypothetical protein